MTPSTLPLTNSERLIDTRPLVLTIMPSRKKKSKAKGRKPAAGKGGAKGTDNVQTEQGAPLDSEMRRLKINEPRGEQQDDDNEEDALLEEAIKLAAVEEEEMKVKEKANCTHGYNPSSMFQARFCEDYFKIYFEEFYASTHNKLLDRLTDGFRAGAKYVKELKRDANLERIKSYSLAEGAKFILAGGNYDDARLCAVLAMYMKLVIEVELVPDRQKMLELLDGDEHTLVQFFRKQIPCSCLDEKYKEVKSITKMGVCYNEECPLPDHRAIRSKMLQCTGCHNVSYCSNECHLRCFHGVCVSARERGALGCVVCELAQFPTYIY
jgi:hypothetical protein